MEKGPTTDSVRCTAVCADGSACRAWAVRGTDPPRCAPHGGGRAAVGAPEGNQNAQTHGFYARAHVPDQGWTIDTLVADLAARHAGLSNYIGRLLADDQADPRDVARLFALYRVSAARLERLLQERELVHRVEERLRSIVTQARKPAAGKPVAGKPAPSNPAVLDSGSGEPEPER